MSSGKLRSSMKFYRSPTIRHHLHTGGTEMGGVRAKGRLVFSPDDKFIAAFAISYRRTLGRRQSLSVTA
jgi:hypothetical protein